MTFNVEHWDIGDDNFAFVYARKNIIGQVSCVHILVSKKNIFLSILMSSVVYVHFSQLVNHCVT